MADTYLDCVYCGYVIDPDDVVKTASGPAHQECAEDAGDFNGNRDEFDPGIPKPGM